MSVSLKQLDDMTDQLGRAELELSKSILLLTIASNDPDLVAEEERVMVSAVATAESARDRVFETTDLIEDFAHLEID